VFNVKKSLPDATAFCIDAAFNFHKCKSRPLDLPLPTSLNAFGERSFLAYRAMPAWP